jgi:transcription initiation factor TFIIB
MSGSPADEWGYCPGCAGATVVVINHTTGDTVCTACAVVLEARYITDERPESPPQRTEQRPRQAISRRQALQHQHLLQRCQEVLRRQQGRPAARRRDKAHLLDDGCRAIADMADRLGLVAAVRDQAKETFKKMMTKEGKGSCCPVVRNRDSVYAACIYIACRNLGISLTYKELTFTSISCAQAAVARKDIGKMTTHIKRLLQEEDGLQPGQGRRPCRVVPEPDSYIELCPRDLSD